MGELLRADGTKMKRLLAWLVRQDKGLHGTLSAATIAEGVEAVVGVVVPVADVCAAAAGSAKRKEALCLAAGGATREALVSYAEFVSAALG